MWIPMLQAATGCTPGGIKGGGEEYVKAFGQKIPPLLARANQLFPLHARTEDNGAEDNSEYEELLPVSPP